MQDIGRKDDKNKPRVNLLFSDFPLALLEVAKVATFGAEKYTDSGWKHVENKEKRYADAKDRHSLCAHLGEGVDTESGYLHLAHEAWNVLVLLQIKLEQENELS
jgi:hypothetical protein